jgi:hypothetical protein
MAEDIKAISPTGGRGDSQGDLDDGASRVPMESLRDCYSPSRFR